MQLALRRVAAVLATTVMGAALLAAPATASETGLSGVVTDESGAPISACVYAYSLDYEYAGDACTAEDGSWEMPGLDGTYRVRVDNYGGGYIGEWAQDAREFYEAADTTAPDGRRGPGPGRHPHGHPHGRRRPAGGVRLRRRLRGERPVPVEFGSTDENGNWQLTVPPGAYKVQMSSWPAEIWAFGASSHATASTIEVAAGGTVETNHFKPAAKVTGRITEAKTEATRERRLRDAAAAHRHRHG